MSAVLEFTPSEIRPPAAETVADLVERLGSIPLARILLIPAPGTAIEQDCLTRIEGAGVEKRVCELVDGTLVEKAMGYYESLLASILNHLLQGFVLEHNLGIVLGEAGALRLFEGQVRVPDISFLSWERFPGRRLPPEPIPAVAPDLAVEVLSESNTEAEMRRKLHDYFQAGVRLVWLADPVTQTVRVYQAVEDYETLDCEGVLDGRDVLPGFTLRVGDWFEQAPARPTA